MSLEKGQDNKGDDREVATLAGGCFWCLEAVFDAVEGIEKVVSGYSGGTTLSPSYNEVCSGATGHAEAVQLVFDPEKISFKQILQIFFTVHDPTTLNRQGADIGTQYRSAIFYHNGGQKTTAGQVIGEFNNANVFGARIVTEVLPFREFYPAEEYHREYFKRNPGQPYCNAVITPKLAKLRKLYFDQLKK
ncbi:peptide-methionine (S)-S-oxide reductase MsrA [Chloroflexota bacterium]